MGKNCKNIWGINPSEKLDAIIVRDAIIRCFKSAHQEVLEEMKEYHRFENEKEFEEMKSLNVKMLVSKFIEDEGGDFEKPTKKDLISLVKKLKEYAENFRNPEIIEKHEEEIQLLINKL